MEIRLRDVSTGTGSTGAPFFLNPRNSSSHQPELFGVFLSKNSVWELVRKLRLSREFVELFSV